MKWTLDVGSRRIEVSSPEQLHLQLLAVQRESMSSPIIALLNAPDGSTMAIGLGSQRSVLNFISSGGWPSRHAVDETAGDGMLQYLLSGQVTEVPERGTVCVEVAINACVEFMKSGKVCERLQWEDD